MGLFRRVWTWIWAYFGRSEPRFSLFWHFSGDLSLDFGLLGLFRGVLAWILTFGAYFQDMSLDFGGDFCSLGDRSIYKIRPISGGLGLDLGLFRGI